jgi:hypothetical protein
MIKRLTVLAVVLVTAVAACNDGGDGSGGGQGGGGLSDAEQAYVDDAMEDFDAEDAEPLTRDDAECMVTRLVQDVGVERLEEIGLTAESFSTDEDLPDDLSEEDARRVLDSMGRCFDLRELFLAGLAEDEDIPAEAQACLEEQLDDDFVDRVMLTLLTEGEEALSEDSAMASEMIAMFTECQGAAG